MNLVIQVISFISFRIKFWHYVLQDKALSTVGKTAHILNEGAIVAGR